MDHFVVEGGKRLRGTVRINGSKNAALPILIATLLTDDPCTIHNVPDLRDIRTTFKLIEQLGKRVSRAGATVRVEPQRRLATWASYDLVKQMRASVLVAGPLLARFGKARVALPGGCAIGLRPIDLHLAGFKRMGAEVAVIEGDVVLKAGRLKPATIPLRFPSVGATENLMMAAARVPGLTVIKNAAREPEIEDLADFLNRMGAEVSGAGGKIIRVRGSANLRGAEHSVIPDRLETGTFLIACASTGGRIRLQGVEPEHLRAVLAALKRSGAKIKESPGVLEIEMRGRPRPVSVRTAPHPGFPTDLQAVWMAYMALAKGRTRIVEEIFENRFIQAAELRRMGAQIRIEGRTAEVDGIDWLNGAPIMASDIRGGAALVVAAVAAKRRSEIQRVYHIDRGYERIELKLRRLGADIRRVHRLPGKRRS